MRTLAIRLVVGTALYAVTAAQTSVPPELTPAWHIEGSWMGVAADESTGIIYVVGRDRMAEVDVTGQIRRQTRLVRYFSAGWKLRLAKLPRPTLLTFWIWGGDLHALDLNGNLLWTYPRFMGIDDVWASDLDGDQTDEIIVGYNGSTGVHVIDAKGQFRWKSTAIGGVSHVSAGDVLSRGRPQVVTTSAQVHIFSDDGERRDVIAPGLGPHMLRVQKVRAEDNAATIFVVGRKATALPPFATPPRGWVEPPPATVVAALSGDGARKWTLELPPSDVTAADVAASRPWLAVVTQSGQVYVIDAVNGRILGLAASQGARPEVAWAGTPPLLLVATGGTLNAFHVGAP